MNFGHEVAAWVALSVQGINLAAIGLLARLMWKDSQRLARVEQFLNDKLNGVGRDR